MRMHAGDHEVESIAVTYVSHPRMVTMATTRRPRAIGELCMGQALSAPHTTSAKPSICKRAICSMAHPSRHVPPPRGAQGSESTSVSNDNDDDRNDGVCRVVVCGRGKREQIRTGRPQQAVSTMHSASWAHVRAR